MSGLLELYSALHSGSQQARLGGIEAKTSINRNEVDSRGKRAGPTGIASLDRLTQRLQTNVPHPSTGHEKGRPWTSESPGPAECQLRESVARGGRPIASD